VTLPDTCTCEFYGKKKVLGHHDDYSNVDTNAICSGAAIAP